MKVLKRNGRSVNFNPSKITQRIKREANGLKVNADETAIKVISQMADGITTEELDTLSVEIASSRVVKHPDYSKLAARLFITALRKSTPDKFSDSVDHIQDETSVLSDRFVRFVDINKEDLDRAICQDRDFNHSIFGLRTLEKSYLLRGKEPKQGIDGKVIERPQYMWMRTAIEVSGYKLKDALENYELMSQGYFTHATPTLFNSGTKLSQLSSCFLIGNKGDSIDGLFDTMKDVARISKLAGGIGLHIHNVRAKGSHIAGTNGKSDGVLPMMKTYNEVSRWINQGGKRKGSFAIYYEPWHADVFELLELRKNHGKEEMRARDLFYAMWTPDLFMERVRDNGDWTLFCPNVLLNNGIILQDVFGDEFKKDYEKAESLGLGKTIKARDLWNKIVVSQMETGTPYMLYKDSANKRTNQQNIGVIKSSNLCAEIMEYSDPNEQAVCNLASIALPMFLWKRKDGFAFDFVTLGDVTRRVIRNLDNVIDTNYYPTDETRKSNFDHRPVGLGVQGLADTYALMGYAFDSPEAKLLNKQIFEVMYFNALKESNAIAEKKGFYLTFEGSPASDGILQFDMYDEGPWNYDDSYIGKNDWNRLKDDIQYGAGLRNSLLIALMPTASTSQILGNNECFEPFTSNLSTRSTLSGTHIVVNEHLIRDLEAEGLWDDRMENKLKDENGSVQNIPEIPVEIRERYKTAYEISQKVIIDQCADRQRFICQSQSMNLFMADPSESKISSMHMYAWKSQVKTGMYYLRSKSAVNAIKFTVDKAENNKVEVKPIDPNDFRARIEAAKKASENDEDCLMCGS